MAEDGETKQKRRRRRVPKRATRDGLERAALRYLERYASSAADPCRVLMERVERSARFRGTDTEAGAERVDSIVGRHLQAGLLDDDAYAELRVERLFAQGYGRRRIARRQKGVGNDAVRNALDNLAK